MKTKVYREIASKLDAMRHCTRDSDAGNRWYDMHKDVLDFIADNYLASGSGFDSGTTIDVDASRPNKIVLHTSYHHMNECGYYDGWSEHSVVVTPSLINPIDVKITGRDCNGFKDYAFEVFFWALLEDIDTQDIWERMGKPSY